MRQVSIHRDFNSWRTIARRLLVDEVPPDQVVWIDNESAPALTDLLPPDTDTESLPASAALTVPKAFVQLATVAACHRDPVRWPTLYRTLWRLTHGEHQLLERITDVDVYPLLMMEKAVRRDRHKMTAFVRFRKVETPEGEQYIAWHRPDHFIVRLTAPFFRERFASMRWTILTPDDSVSWDGQELTFSPGVPVSAAPKADDLEALWKTYYANIFNPARIKLNAMRKEMPVKHWATMPETQLIPDLLRDAPRRVEEMVKRTRQINAPSTKIPGNHAPGANVPGPTARNHTAPGHNSPDHTSPGSNAGIGVWRDPSTCPVGASAAEFVPTSPNGSPVPLPQLREAAKGCRGCGIYCNATQVVFGEGKAHARMIIVGEQPGDSEDLAGRPFIGPAGQLLDEVMQQVGLPREEAYVTNAVKHFKWEARGKRRIHSKPSSREVAACKPWLQAEIAAIQPQMILALGATAAQSLFGNQFRVTQSRGKPIPSPLAPWCMATIHPSAILRTPSEDRDRARADFAADLSVAARALQKLTADR